MGLRTPWEGLGATGCALCGLRRTRTEEGQGLGWCSGLQDMSGVLRMTDMSSQTPEGIKVPCSSLLIFQLLPMV